MRKLPDILIVGGGAIGLACAFSMALDGAHVTVLDSNEPGQATHAAAGMLAPLAESRGPGAFLDMAVSSLRKYPEFINGLRIHSDTQIEIQGAGMLHVALTKKEEEAQRLAIPWQGKTCLMLTVLPVEDIPLLEPALGLNIRSAVYSPEERQVDPRLLHKALVLACRSLGVAIHSPSTALDFQMDTRTVTSVATADDVFFAEKILVCGGAWSAGLSGKLGITLPVTPKRGQALALGQTPPLLLRHTIYSHQGYLVPRQDRVIVGATEEDAGFNAEPTAEGKAFLLEKAYSLVPALSALPVVESWAGLRPISPDGLPLLGQLSGWDNVFVATGHGRNGILLAPATGTMMANHLLHDTPPPSAFDPGRFTRQN